MALKRSLMNTIAEYDGVWYEGDSASLRVMLENTLLLPICVVNQHSGGEMLFREDYFNSATRIRRGRVYRKDDVAAAWSTGNVGVHPYRPDLFANMPKLRSRKSYTTFADFIRVGSTAILGDNNAQSYWTVIFAEKAGLEAHYLTLKSKTYFGVLPEVNRSAIPEANRQDILQALDAVVEAAPIQAPQPVIDACRNAACHMITAKFPQSNPTGEKDLGPMVRWLNDNKHKTKASGADIINRLHSRAKANAAAQHRTRLVSRQDANLAVGAIAFLLQDFGWAEEGI